MVTLWEFHFWVGEDHEVAVVELKADVVQMVHDTVLDFHWIHAVLQHLLLLVVGLQLLFVIHIVFFYFNVPQICLFEVSVQK